MAQVNLRGSQQPPPPFTAPRTSPFSVLRMTEHTSSSEIEGEGIHAPESLRCGSLHIRTIVKSCNGMYRTWRWVPKWLVLNALALTIHNAKDTPVQTTILLVDIVSVTQGNLGPYSLLLETRDKRFHFSLRHKDEMLSWKNDICSRIPLPPRDLNVLEGIPYHKHDYEEEENVPDLEPLTPPAPYTSIAPPAYSPAPESENAIESPALRLNEAELARKEADLQAKERDLERREEEIRRKEMELQLETRFLEIDYYRRLKEVESFYQLEMERERGPPQRPASTPCDTITSEPANTSKGKQVANTIASSLPQPRAEEVITSTSTTNGTMTPRLSPQPDVTPTKTAGSGDRLNHFREDVRSILSSWESGYVSSISDTCASQSGFSNVVYYLTMEQVAPLLRHQRQWNDLETAKSLTWDAFPWPVLKRVASVQDIIQKEVEAYLESMYRLPENMFQTMKEHIMDNVRRWDVNWMEAKVFGRVHDNDLEKVKRGVIRVGGILNSILNTTPE